jgi:urea transport system permease protein
VSAAPFRTRTPLLGLQGWIALSLFVVVAAVLVPVLNLLPAEGSSLRLPDFLIALLGKFLCYAIVALAVDLIWGYTGILSLGHGVFFALGGYAMGMYLMRSIGTEGVYASDLPDFMVFLDWKELPWFWYGFQHFAFAFAMALFVPAALAFAFGFFAFRSRITGVYFSIITQAMTFAFMLLFFRNDTGFGGNNGLTDFKRILGFPLQNPGTRVGLYVASVLALAAAFLACRAIVTSKLGRLLRAIRDAEAKVRFSGYDTLRYKLFVWTFSAALCGLAGALYVPQVGIINPSEMQPASSIEMAIWVAVGGRGTLVGAVGGAFLVNAAKSWFTVAAPDTWLYVLGGTFVLVTLVAPDGVLGLARRLRVPGRAGGKAAADAQGLENGLEDTLEGAFEKAET